MGGRPRSLECDRAILEAALSEYAAHGLEGMSVDAVAARAGVSKATIYRRYASKAELVVAAGSAASEEHAPVPDCGSLREDLTTALHNLRRLLEDPVVGAAKRMLLVDAMRDRELARLHGESVGARRQGMQELFRRAAERGELRPDVDVEFAAESMGASLFYRYLVMHDRATDVYIDAVVDDLIARYGAEQSVALGAPNRKL
jgi:AcrR family transcriptional regulator